MTNDKKAEYRKTIEYTNNLLKVAGEVKGVKLKDRIRIANRVKSARLIGFLKNELNWDDAKIKRLLKRVKPTALDYFNY